MAKSLTNNRKKEKRELFPNIPTLVTADIGNSFIKVVLTTIWNIDDGREVEVSHSVVMYPHAMRGVTEANFDQAVEQSRHMDGELFGYYHRRNDIEKFVRVGYSAEIRPDIMKAGEEKYRPDYMPVLMVPGLLAHLPDGAEDIRLMVTYPPGDWRFKEEIVRSLGGVHTVTRSDGQKMKYKIRKVSTMPESSGGLRDYMLDSTGLMPNENHSPLPDGSGLVIDIGGQIMNWAICRNDGWVDTSQPVSIDYGVNNVMRDLSDLMLADPSMKDRIPHRGNSLPLDGDMRNALRKKEYFSRGNPIDVTPMVDEAMRSLWNQINSIYHQRFDGGRPYRYIMVTGGGGGLIIDDLIPLLQFNPDRVFLANKDVDTILLANVYGAAKVHAADMLVEFGYASPA